MEIHVEKYAMNFYKVGIGVPTRDVWKPDFGQSLFMMGIASMSLIDGTIGFRLMNKTQCSIPKLARMQLAQNAIDAECTHLLFLDDDMRFPMNTLAKLLEADKDIIGANCVTKEYPPRPTAKGLDGQPLYTNQNDTGVQEVQSVGTGILLIKTGVFSRIKKPWFDDPYEPSGDKLALGEDRYFCKNAREAGYKIWIDHDISKDVKHIGDWPYGHQMTEYYDAAD